MQQLLAVRDAEERLEARRTLGFLQSVRQAIPASLADETDAQNAYKRFESDLLTRANGKRPNAESTTRYRPSKNQTRKVKAQRPALPDRTR